MYVGNRKHFIVIWTFMSIVGSVCAADRDQQQYPDVLSAQVKQRGDNRFDFDVTISSPYDTPSRYADAFHVSADDGKVLGERILAHDHANEQPFTRELYGVYIPREIREVVVQAKDKKFGYGGKAVNVILPGRQ